MEEIVTIQEPVMQMVNATGQYFDTGTNLFGIFAVVAIAIGIMAILLYASTSIEHFKKFKRIYRVLFYLARMVYYFAFGALTIVVIGGPCILGYYAFQSASENAESIIPMLQTIGFYALIFIGVSVLGFIMQKKVWSKLFKYHKIEKENKKQETQKC